MQFDIFYNIESLFHNDNSIIGNVQFHYGDNFGNEFCTSTSAVMYAKVLVQKLGYKDIIKQQRIFHRDLLINLPIREYHFPILDIQFDIFLLSFLTCIVKQSASEFLNGLVIEKNPFLKIVPMAKLDSFSLSCSLKYCSHLIYL